LNGFWNKIKALLRPKEIIKDIHEIDFGELKAKGIRALIVDIDDTLIPRKVKEINPEVFEWVAARKEEGFRLCIVSNSRIHRVKYIGSALGLPTVSALFLGMKPLPFAFWKSLKILNAKSEETAMIGDQLFMDILGANLLNIYTIFVKHITEETFWFRKWMRKAEKWVLSKLKP